MNPDVTLSANTTSIKRPIMSHVDEILQEVYDIKAAINQEANHDIATLIRNAQAVAARLTPNAVRVRLS
jgi:hypothetical protein